MLEAIWMPGEEWPMTGKDGRGKLRWQELDLSWSAIEEEEEILFIVTVHTPQAGMMSIYME